MAFVSAGGNNRKKEIGEFCTPIYNTVRLTVARAHKSPTRLPSLAHRSHKRSHRTHPYARPTPERIHNPKIRGQITRSPVLPPVPVSPLQRNSRVAKFESSSSDNDEPSETDIDWDGWPDGDFDVLLPMAFVVEHNNLHVHWATHSLGGRGGSTEANTWQKGKLTRRKCQGAIECDNEECTIITRPQTRASGIAKQLEEPCACGGNFIHHSCDVLSTLHTFKGGVYYHNGGTHHHSRPTVRLHLSKTEQQDFSRIVGAHPTTGPLQLLVGRPGVDGPAASVANISPVLINADRVKYERRKVLKGPGGYGGDNFLKEFAKFETSNPGFIRTAQFGQITVIVMQTSFMASRLIKAMSVKAEAVNGIVSDAAHGFWRERNSLLIVSSTYEPVHLKCWVPGLISYSNGGTQEHYRIHFFELFLSIAQECDTRRIEVTDDAFANVRSHLFRRYVC